MAAIIYIYAEAVPTSSNKSEEIITPTAEVHIVPSTSETIISADTEQELVTEAETAVDTVASISEATQKVILENSPVLYPELAYVIYYDVAMTEDLLINVRFAIKELGEVDYTTYTSSAITAMATEMNRLRDLEAELVSDINHYLKWEKEHYYAAKVWEYLMHRGFSNEVTCAIIGNMMIETSGGSLNLNPTIYSPSKNYYGLCQWSQKYYPETKNMSFEEQLDYLFNSLQEEFDVFGNKYKKGFNFEAFLNMTDPAKAALAFAKVYERCGSGGYARRQEAAVRAYEYFDLNS
jgi:hypothetical protein